MKLFDGIRRRRAARLIEGAKRGDRDAFAAIYEEYASEIRQYSVAVLKNADEAEDVVQATMVAAIRSLPGEQRDIDLRPWLYRVALNEAIDLRRRSGGPPLVPLPPDEPSAEQVVVAREDMQLVLSDVATLPTRQRAALVMRVLGGSGYEAIADTLGVTVHGARQAVYEARLTLEAMETGRRMRCETVLDILATGDRRRIKRRELQGHLSVCRACAEEAERQGVGRRRLRLLSPIPALAWVFGRLQAANPGASLGTALVAAAATGGLALAGLAFSIPSSDSAPDAEGAGPAAAPSTSIPQPAPSTAQARKPSPSDAAGEDDRDTGSGDSAADVANTAGDGSAAGVPVPAGSPEAGGSDPVPAPALPNVPSPGPGPGAGTPPAPPEEPAPEPPEPCALLTVPGVAGVGCDLSLDLALLP